MDINMRLPLIRDSRKPNDFPRNATASAKRIFVEPDNTFWGNQRIFFDIPLVCFFEKHISSAGSTASGLGLMVGA